MSRVYSIHGLVEIRLKENLKRRHRLGKYTKIQDNINLAPLPSSDENTYIYGSNRRDCA